MHCTIQTKINKMGKASNFLTVEIFLIMYPVQLERNMPGLSQEKQKTFFSMVGGGGGGGGGGGLGEAGRRTSKVCSITQT